MYLSVGVVLHYAQVCGHSVSPLEEASFSVPDKMARNIIRIVLISISLVTCGSMVVYGASPRFFGELSDHKLMSTSAKLFLPLENIALILISILVNVTLRFLIFCEAVKTRNHSNLEDKRLALGFLASSLTAFLVVMLASVAYQKFYAPRGERDKMLTRKVVFFFVAVALPISAVLLHMRMRNFLMKKCKEKLDRSISEITVMTRRVRRTLARALVVPYVDIENGTKEVV